MIRFKVIKGGNLLLGAAVIILAAVIIAIIITSTADKYTSVPPTAQVFSHADALIPSPYSSENEHTDAVASIPQEIHTQVLPASNGMRVLIYHTHTHEAYEQTETAEYTELERWRTDDNEYNIVRVGAELAKMLEERGFSVTHDTTDHEQSDLSTAYTRSLETLSNHSDVMYDLYIDLHRDAYTEGAELTCSYAGSDSAKLMLLIGRGDNFAVKPYFDENYTLACNITDEINMLCPGLCRDVMVKTGRYNQHIAPNSILVEVGNNMNTLEEALSSIPVLADAIEQVMTDNEESSYMTVSYTGK